MSTDAKYRGRYLVLASCRTEARIVRFSAQPSVGMNALWRKSRSVNNMILFAKILCNVLTKIDSEATVMGRKSSGFDATFFFGMNVVRAPCKHVGRRPCRINKFRTTCRTTIGQDLRSRPVKPSGPAADPAEGKDALMSREVIRKKGV